ncbi:MAG TPA: hypothetical protein DCL44_02565 [Elusimicrobia bacterium]|nr:hypothetical protein [Elusimicrobiota bacterium]
MSAPEFAYTPEEIRAIAASARNEFEQSIGHILNIPQEQRNFENTVLAFENAKDKLTISVQIPQFLALVVENADVRKASEELRLKMGQYVVDLMTREDVYKAFKKYSEKGEKLQPIEKRLLEKRLREFQKNGLGLEPHKREKVRQLLKELVGLNLEFQKNLRGVSDALEVTNDELKGLSEEYKARLKRTPGGGYLVTMDYPDYNPFMENAESDSARRRLCQMFNNRCVDLNLKLLEAALSARRELAKLLGYRTYADYVLDDRMAKNSKVVFAFLKRLQTKMKKKGRMELKARLKLKGPGATKLKSWEVAYYNNLLRKTKYSIDHEKIREYFPLETVLEGMFEVCGELIGARFVPAVLPTWHKDVRSYEVRDADGSLVAYFYLDLFPREGKYKHTICSSLRSERELENGDWELPAAAILSNFSSSSGRTPPLLKFSEVNTLFHEFGHVLQILFSRAKYSRLASVNAAWDFVEIPSTTIQQWSYEPSILRRISGHYKDKARKLPEETIEGLSAAKNINSGMFYLRMIALSLIDMYYHTLPGRMDIAKVYAQLMEKVSLVPVDGDSHPEASFGHLMGGYSGGYYSYIWAEVIAADIFGVFQAAGIMDTATGCRYRQTILAPGASLDEAGQVERFLGRPFNETAFLKSIGAA